MTSVTQESLNFPENLNPGFYALIIEKPDVIFVLKIKKIRN
jgi:hypothetical protein